MANVTEALVKILAETNVPEVAKKAADGLESLEEGLKDIGTAAKRASRAIDKSFKAIMRSAAALAASIGAATFAFIKMADRAGKLQVIEQAFSNFTDRAAYAFDDFSDNADGLLKDLRRVTQGAVSDFDLQKQAVQGYMLIGEQLASEMPALFEVGFAGAIAQGENVNYMLESIMKGIGRTSVRWLDNAGIVVKASEEYERFGKELGKTADQLTEQEKRMALVNATVREGQRFITALGDTQSLLIIKTQALRASLVNLKDSILGELTPAFIALLDIINGFVAKSVPVIQDWVKGFTSAFYKVTLEISNSAQRMGLQAGQWAKAALSWGANIGAQFAGGILQGFSQAFAFVVNAIASLLTVFQPGSPPPIAPDIDKWGMGTIAEWYSAMNEYTPDFNNILDKLQKQLSDKPKRRLMEWGVNAIAEWAEGLSIFDLELLEMQVEQQLDNASKALEGLTQKLSGEESQLFEMQVLGADPSAIRSQLAQVKATKESVKAKEAEVQRLEDRRDEIQEQLNLFRKLNQIISQMDDAMSSASEAAKKLGGAGGLDDILGPDAFDFSGIGGSVDDLESKIKGFKETLLEIFEDPLTIIEDAWNESFGRMEEAWGNFTEALDETGIGKWFEENSGGIANFTGKLLGVWIFAVLATKGIKLLLSPLLALFSITTPLSKGLLKISRALFFIIPALGGILIPLLAVMGGLLVLIGVSSLLANQRIPNLASQMSTLQIVMFGLAEAALAARAFLGILVIKFYDIATAAQEAAAGALDAMANLIDGLAELPGAGSFFEGMAKNFRESAGEIRDEAEGTRGEIRGIVSDWVSKADWKNGFDFSEPVEALAGLQGSADEVGVKFGTYLPTILKTDFAGALNETSTNTSDFTESVIKEMGLMGEDVGNTIIPSMTEKMETSISESYLNSIGNTEDWSDDMQSKYEELSKDVVGGKSAVVPDMMEEMQKVMDEVGWEIVGETREWGAHIFGVLDGLRVATDDLLKSLKKLKEWADNNEIHIRIHSDPVDPALLPGSLPPLAQGIKDINEHLRDTRRIGGLGVLTPPSTNNTSTLNFNEPLMSGMTFVVPNAAVGRQMAEDLSREMGDMINSRRQPA